jgi:hypothetical protein
MQEKSSQATAEKHISHLKSLFAGGRSVEQLRADRREATRAACADYWRRINRLAALRYGRVQQ